jgi:Protein of unknown function (DUF1236)
MRNLVIAATTALMMTSPIAWGQAPSERAAPPATTTVNLTLEQRHVIKEVVKDLRLPKAPENAPATVGGTVPQSVPLQDMPAEIGTKVPQVKTHRFFVTNDRIVLVNPNDNRIADVIE